MSDVSDLAESVSTGWPITTLLACKRCGVLLWNAEAHYAEAHSFPCVVDQCPQRFYRYADLNAHSHEHHSEAHEDDTGNVLFRYPGVDSAGDFIWRAQ
jgi:hypothetical protein